MENSAQTKRTYFVYIVTALISLFIFVFLVWSLRSLILPCTVGVTLAYICKPLLRFLQKKGFPHSIALMLLFGLFFLVVSFFTNQIKSTIPDEKGMLELRVRIQYKLDQKYQSLMGTSQSNEKGNILFNLFGGELQPVIKKVNQALQLDSNEKQLFEQFLNTKNEQVRKKLSRYYTSNQRLAKTKVREKSASDKKSKKVQTTQQGSLLATIGEIVSQWLAAPFIFIFFLIDQGEIKKSIVSLVPNRYFEMTLTVIDSVDDALGKYLRGTLLECFLVGFTIFISLFFIGVDLRWAGIIGIIAGGANAIPFLGPAIGLIVGASYALIVEEIAPVLPFVNTDNMMLWVIVAVGIAQVLDNAFFQPVILGSAVSLHPVIVILGVMGGSILFGTAGMLLAIPFIVIVKGVITTLFKQLRAYQLIY